MTNFTVRFLYEIYFELCLCVMINASFVDKNDDSQVTAWVISLILAVLAFGALITITVLFWKHGPAVKQSYEQKSFWSSFWGYRPIRREMHD